MAYQLKPAVAKWAPKVLHSKGDYFGEYRLPEFEFKWLDSKGKSHPMHVVGRFLECGVHSQALTRDLLIGGNAEIECLALSRDWHSLLVSAQGQVFSNFLREEPAHHFAGETAIGRSPNMRAMQTAVAATMVLAVSATTGIDQARAAELLGWSESAHRLGPKWLARSQEHGLAPEYWALIGELQDAEMEAWFRRGGPAVEHMLEHVADRERRYVDLILANLPQVVGLEVNPFVPGESKWNELWPLPTPWEKINVMYQLAEDDWNWPQKYKGLVKDISRMSKGGDCGVEVDEVLRFAAQQLRPNWDQAAIAPEVPFALDEVHSRITANQKGELVCLDHLDNAWCRNRLDEICGYLLVADEKIPLLLQVKVDRLRTWVDSLLASRLDVKRQELLVQAWRQHPKAWSRADELEKFLELPLRAGNIPAYIAGRVTPIEALAWNRQGLNQGWQISLAKMFQGVSSEVPENELAQVVASWSEQEFVQIENELEKRPELTRQVLEHGLRGWTPARLVERIVDSGAVLGSPDLGVADFMQPAFFPFVLAKYASVRVGSTISEYAITPGDWLVDAPVGEESLVADDAVEVVVSN